jgi:hypothetical protein
MRKTVALLLGLAGLILAVGVPIAVALWLNLDPGKKPGLLVGGMMPGLGVLLLARKLWKGGEAPRPRPELIPPGYQVCELCGKTLPATEGVARQFDPQTPRARIAFACHACTRYRTKRALTVLVLFLAALGVFALAVQLTIPGPKKN